VTKPQWRHGIAVSPNLQRPDRPRIYLNAHTDGADFCSGQTAPAAVALAPGARRLWVYVDHTGNQPRHLILADPNRPFKEVGRD